MLIWKCILVRLRPKNAFRSSSSNSENKIETSLFVQKPYLRTNYLESNKEDINLKNQLRIGNLPHPISIREAAAKTYVDKRFNDSSIKKHCSCWIWWWKFW